jgi:isopropylmalate/homocitrate/citramalate synthase
MNPLPRRVEVVEVGPRDGLQNEPASVSTADKIRFVDLLSAAGPPVIEVSAFVSARRVPQMADADAVFAGITPLEAVRYTALVPNLAGLDRARRAGVREIAIFAAASETFSRRNINQTIDESLESYGRVVAAALADGMRVRAYLSTAFGCPYEGDVSPARVGELAGRLSDLGAFEVSIGDTIGVAHPAQVAPVLESVARHVDLEQVALHFHDTRGTALANVLAALDLGIAIFDASAGGLGGCPFAPGAAGNLATEDLVYMLEGYGIETGISLPALVEASRFIEQRIGRELPSRYVQALKGNARRAEQDRPMGDQP